MVGDKNDTSRENAKRKFEGGDERYGGEIVIKIPVPPGFRLERAVCNHGFFMMAPNRWNPTSKVLERPLRIADSVHSVPVSISHPCFSKCLTVAIQQPLRRLSINNDDINIIQVQVKRMLRLSEKDESCIKEFHKIHPEARRQGFGRLFRSALLFEDLVKSLLLCNCMFSDSLKMAKALCKLQKLLTEAGRGCKNNRRKSALSSSGNFPSPQELASLGEDDKLIKECRLGFREHYILKLASDVSLGKIDLDELENCCDETELLAKFSQIKGFGPFACANALMSIGFYERIPQDTETLRMLQKRYKIERGEKKFVAGKITEIYGRYSPFQCLAYWFDMLKYYEADVGKLSDLNSSKYGAVSGGKIDPSSSQSRK